MGICVCVDPTMFVSVSDSDLWEGTAKAAEGHLAHACFLKAREEGMVVEVNWQDQDSSSGNSFRSIFQMAR